MFNAVELGNVLKLSSWPVETKKEIALSLPYLGEYMLSYLNTRLLATGSVYDADRVVRNISRISLLYRNLQNGDTTGLEDEVRYFASSVSGIDNEAVLAFVVDVRKSPLISSLLDQSSSLILCGIEADYSQELPVEIFLELLSDRLSEFIQVADVFYETKRYFYYKVLDEEIDEIANLFQQMILSSPLLIGDRTNTENGGVEGISIREWLQDFHEQKGADGNDSFNVTNYLIKSPLAEKLDQIEKDALTKILKLYSWLYHPIVNSKEITDYESHRNLIYKPDDFGTSLETRENVINAAESQLAEPSIVAQPVVEPKRKPVPIIPSQPDAPPLYKIGAKDTKNISQQEKKGLIYDIPTNIDIDAEAKARQHRQVELLKIQVKLDDLKKRKKKNS